VTVLRMVAVMQRHAAQEDAGVRVLARFKVNKLDCVSVFKATTKEDFKDVVKLLPENTPLPASNKMTCASTQLACMQGWAPACTMHAHAARLPCAGTRAARMCAMHACVRVPRPPAGT
jgi:hypothetical protein